MDPNEQAILDLIAGSKKLGVELTPEQANYILTEVKEFQKDASDALDKANETLDKFKTKED